MTISGGDRLLEHWPAMVRVCQRTLGNREEAEDCASAALLGVVQRGGLDGVDSGEAWMVSIAKRRAADVLRSRARDERRAERLAAKHDLVIADVAEHIVERAEAGWLSQAAAEFLPARTQELLGALTAGMTITEAAEHLGMTKRAAESHLHRARVALRPVWAAAFSVFAWACGAVRRAAPAGPQVALAAAAVVTLGTGPQLPQEARPGEAAPSSTSATGQDHRPSRPAAASDSATASVPSVRRQTAPAEHRAAPGPAAAPRRIGTASTGVDVSAERRDGPSQPVPVLLDCVENLQLTAEHVGC